MRFFNLAEEKGHRMQKARFLQVHNKHEGNDVITLFTILKNSIPSEIIFGLISKALSLTQLF